MAKHLNVNGTKKYNTTQTKFRVHEAHIEMFMEWNKDAEIIRKTNEGYYEVCIPDKRREQ